MEQCKDHFAKMFYGTLRRAISRIEPLTITLSCVGILVAYYIGIYATGAIHSPSRWLGAALACTSFVTVMQAPDYKTSLRPSMMRIVGTFVGALIAYIYLRMFHFSVVGMILTAFLLEALCMFLGIYKESRIATITLIIIMLVSHMFSEENPALNCVLRFSESAVGVGVGLTLRWLVERWTKFREHLMHRGRKEDGEHLSLETMPMRWGHYRIVAITSLGQLTGGALSTLVGVVIPLMQVLTHRTLSPLNQGLVASMSLVGIMFGSVIIGSWSDRRGYLPLFRLSPIIIFIGAVAASFTSSLGLLIFWLFVMGFGVGGGYSLDSDYISELMPNRYKELMVGVAKAASSLGNIAMAFVCYYILSHWQGSDSWNGLFLLVAILAIVMILYSIRFTQSPQWLFARGRVQEAEDALHQLLGEDVDLAVASNPTPEECLQQAKTPSSTATQLRRAIFSGMPWACEGFGVYGMGVFLPLMVMRLGLGEGAQGTLKHVSSSVEITSYINLFVGMGFLLGLILLGRKRYVAQQIGGFVLSALGIGVLALGYMLHLAHWVMIVGFIIYNIFLNAGPHLITFILPSKIYPVCERGKGAGIAAAFGKAGAVMGVFLMPLMMGWGGMELVLGVEMGVLLLGAVVTALFSDVMPREEGVFNQR